MVAVKRVLIQSVAQLSEIFVIKGYSNKTCNIGEEELSDKPLTNIDKIPNTVIFMI